MEQQLKEQLKKVLKDKNKRRKIEKAIARELVEHTKKKYRQVAQKLKVAKEQAVENWPETKQKIDHTIAEIPDKITVAKDATLKVTRATGKTIKQFKDWALKNNKNKALVLAGLLALSGATIHLTTQQSRAIKKAQKEEKARLKLLENKLTQKHQITDKESFAQLFNESLPLIQTAFLTSEVYVSKPYTDNGEVINTVGAGSWWYPKNGDPTSSEWIHTSKYVEAHTYLEVDGNQAMNLVKGWFCSREGGRIYRVLCDKLQGTELSINEFVAICGVMYNSERAGLQLCNSITKDENYKKPLEIAKCMMNLKYDDQFENGMLRRNTAQSVSIIMGNSDHCALHSKKIGKNYVTSISVLPLELCQEYKDALNNDDTTLVKELAQKIDFKMSHWLCRYDENGQSALRQVQKEVKDTAIATPICRFVGDTLNVTGDSPYWGDVLYGQAREYNECGDFAKAAEKYEELFAKGFYGADLHIDAAQNYFAMGEYSKCREQCRKAIKGTVEIHQVLPAYQLAVKACNELGDTKNAALNQRKVDSLIAAREAKGQTR